MNFFKKIYIMNIEGTMNPKDLEALKKKLKRIGNESLYLISKYKSIDNEAYDKLIKINYLAHEVYDTITSEHRER